MNTNLTKTDQRLARTPSGNKVLAALRTRWKDRTVEREAWVRGDSGKMEIAKVEKKIPAKNRLYNRGVPAHIWNEFGSLVTPDDVKVFGEIIERDQFEVVKALACLKARDYVIDRSIVVRSWKEAEAAYTPSLLALIKYKGKAKTISLVYLMTQEFLERHGRKNDLNDEKKVRDLAAELVELYPRLTLADFRFIYGAASRIAEEGRSTRRFSFSVDAQQIFELFDDSYRQKFEEAEKRTLDRHYQNTNREKSRRERRTVGDLTPEDLSVGDAVKQTEIYQRHLQTQAEMNGPAPSADQSSPS